MVDLPDMVSPDPKSRSGTIDTTGARIQVPTLVLNPFVVHIDFLRLPYLLHSFLLGFFPRNLVLILSLLELLL